MSYILDALQKAEQERQRGAVPTLQTPVSSQPERPAPAYWAYGLLAAVLLAAGILIGWWQPWRASSTANTPAVPPVQPVIAEAVPAPAAPIMQTAPTPPAVPMHPAAPAGAPVAVPLPAPVAAPVPAPPAVLPKMPEAKPAAGRGPAAPVIDEAMALEALPPAIRQGIPPMTVLVHSYSSQRKDRVVIVNNKPLHEGDSLVAGLKLEEITSEGMIYSYKGYRFKAGVR